MAYFMLLTSKGENGWEENFFLPVGRQIFFLTWTGTKRISEEECQPPSCSKPARNMTKILLSFPCMLQFLYEQRGIGSAGLLAINTLASAPLASMRAQDTYKFTEQLTIPMRDEFDLYDALDR